MRQSAVLIACAFVVLLTACGGGGGTAGPNNGVLPVAPANPHAPAPTAKPTATQTPKATPTPTAPPASTNAVTRIPSTAGRIGLFQVFDYHNGYLPSSQIQQHARRIDAVWASVQPGTWKAAHPGMLVSQYFIMGMDRYGITHHTYSWWQHNHPDWILYACTASGAPTHDIAYMSGINEPDMPIDIHNPSAVAYHLQTQAQAAKNAGYSALAIDQVIFWNIDTGGNPSFGQRVHSSEYACGSWHGNTFQRDYSSPKDPQFAADVVKYVAQARVAAHAYGLTLIVNHPAGPISNPNEQQLLANTDIDMDETGFSDYGHYAQHNGEIFKNELAYVRYAQEHNTGVFVIDKFTNEAHVDAHSFEYSLATYLLGNEGGMLLFVGGAKEYGTMQYHSEYDAAIGHPCTVANSGPVVYSRRFSGGLAVVNASASPQTFTLPAGSYRDIEGRPIKGGALSLGPNDGYVLLGGSGC